MYEFIAAGQLFLLANGATAHENMIFSVSWTKPVEYSYDMNEVDCLDKKSADVSHCWTTVNPKDKIKNFPDDAKAVLIFVKNKTWVPSDSWKNSEGVPLDRSSYCQMDAKFTSSKKYMKTMNHATLVDAQGVGPNKSEEARGVSYNMLVVPLAEDGTFLTSIHHGIWNDCVVEVGVTLMGYYK